MSKSIFLTGSNGFVGKNILKILNTYNFTLYKRGSKINIKENVVINLAGKAHDLKNVTNPESYYLSNTIFSNNLFDAFIKSNSKIFITISSVKAISDNLSTILTEETIPNPKTHYGKSKLLAENYILTTKLPQDKKVFILRPCMIHGPGNKGNLNSLYNIVKFNLPWPLAIFENKRSFCSIENLCFIINELIDNDQIPSGVYNIADDEPLSTNELVDLISKSTSKKIRNIKIPKIIIKAIAKIGDKLKLPFNTEILEKLTETYIVSNKKILNIIKKPLPVSSKEGLIKTFKSFK